MIIDHTEVSEELRGTGAGAHLIEALVKYARSNDMKIMPLCPFAKLMFHKRKEEWSDVWW